MNPKQAASLTQDIVRILQGASKVASHAILVGKDSQSGGVMQQSQYASTNFKKSHNGPIQTQEANRPSSNQFIKNNFEVQDIINNKPIFEDIISKSIENIASHKSNKAIGEENKELNHLFNENKLVNYNELKESSPNTVNNSNTVHIVNESIQNDIQNTLKQNILSENIIMDQKENIPLDNNNHKMSQTYSEFTNENETFIPLREKKPLGNPRAVPSSSLGRAWGFGSMITRVAWNTATTAITTGSLDMKQNIKSEENAILIANTLCRMRGAALKLGQMISFQDSNMVPKVILDAFERVRNQADYMPESQLRYMLGKTYGDNWESEIFSSFDINPIAAASIGQVHQAVLKNGDKVAVKVQYPGVAKSMESDIKNVERLLKLSNLLPRGAFVETSIAQLRYELSLECDYRQEASNQQKYAEYVSKDPFLSKHVSIPKVYKEFSTEHVLVTEMVEDAWTLGDLAEKIEEERKSFGEPKTISTATCDHIASLILSLSLKEVFNFKYMQTDPNWSNFFYSPSKKKIYLIDFGACASYPTTFTHPYMEIVYGAATMNKDLVMKSSTLLGFLTGEESQLMKNAHLKASYIIGEPFRPVYLKQKYDFEKQEMTKKIMEELPVMLRHRLTPPPKLSYALHRKLSGAFLLCCKFGAKTDSAWLLKEIVNQYLIDHPEFSLPPFEMVNLDDTSNTLESKEQL